MTRAVVQWPTADRIPPFAGATEWLNSPPLTPADLRGKVVLVSFWTYTCINWLRTLPYLRAWAEKYNDQGLVLIGVHTPEFTFEHNIDNVQRAIQSMQIHYPVVVDNQYAIWNAFANHYWPALYFVDAEGRIRYHQFGEGEYEMSERVIQQLLVEAGATDVTDSLVVVEPQGAEEAADWTSLESPETYLGYQRSGTFASPGGMIIGRRHAYEQPAALRLNQWALAGTWTVDERAVQLHEAPGSIMFQFHARDVNLVMGPVMQGASVRFRIRLDGESLGSAHGEDVNPDGTGTVTEQRLYQLVRQPEIITDSQFEIEFLDAGIEAYAFTFG